jgi:hypothetical protein
VEEVVRRELNTHLRKEASNSEEPKTLALEEASNNLNQIEVVMSINMHDVSCDVDTGAMVLFMPSSVYQTLRDQLPILEPCSVRLCGVSGETVVTQGVLRDVVKSYGTGTCEPDWYVIGGRRETHLGMNVLYALGMVIDVGAKSVKVRTDPLILMDSKKQGKIEVSLGPLTEAKIPA